MDVKDFDYKLPEESIAQRPPTKRGTTRLLVLQKKTGKVVHSHYSSLDRYLRPGDLVVLNDTKVIKARLNVKNAAGKPRELFLLEKHGTDEQKSDRLCLYKGKIGKGEVLTVGADALEVIDVFPGGMLKIRGTRPLLELANEVGEVPLPPYMKRSATPEDTKRYQTVFAKKHGSVAAPTASLNFTPELVSKLQSKGIKIAYLTLHVGLGTFLPIRTDNIEDHKMHSEYFDIPADTAALIRATRQNGGSIVAIGTTVARTLEYAAKDILSPGSNDIRGEADIFIYPGYKFRLIDVLLTNFHAPRSTVLMLTAALAGWDNLKPAYVEAVAKKYEFLSYGDSMLII
jgi:S-adenosylmethionine:tRNA ribosyltransferase-isomerase